MHPTASARQDLLAADLGQRLLACEHNSQVKQEGKGVRILPFFLPTKSPWLNPIEPKWVHAKKAIVEPDALLSAQQLAERICAHFAHEMRNEVIVTSEHGEKCASLQGKKETFP